MADDVKDALGSVQAISIVLLLATATIGLIGLSPDTADRYTLAATALDSLPAYPCANDTASDAFARRFGGAVAHLDSTMRTLAPSRSVSAIDLMFSPRVSKFSYWSVSGDFVPNGVSIGLSPDHTVASRLSFLESMRGLLRLAIPNADSFAVRVSAKVDSISYPNVPLTLTLDLDPVDTTGAWMESGQIHVRGFVYVPRDSMPNVKPSLATWRDSFVVVVPANVPYLVAVREVSRLMTAHFARQRWLTNKSVPTGVRWSEWTNFILQPLSPAALCIDDRIRPVLLEVAEMELPTARRYLHEQAETLRDRGSVSLLGLTLQNRVAIWVVPLIFACLSLLLLIHLMNVPDHDTRLLRTYPWAPLFPNWTGTLAAFVLFILYPALATWYFVQRIWRVEQAWVAIGLALLAVAANVCGFAILRRMRARG